MAALTETAYGKLLSQTRPRVIKTERENERALAELEALDNLDRRLTPQAKKNAQLLTLLVPKFEDAR